MSLRTFERSSLTASRLEKLFESWPQLTLESMSGTRPVGVNGRPLVISDGLWRAVILRLPGDSSEEAKEGISAEGESIAGRRRSGTGGEADFLWLQVKERKSAGPCCSTEGQAAILCSSSSVAENLIWLSTSAISRWRPALLLSS